MIVVKPRDGERIPVTELERVDINKIFDNSSTKWSGPDYVVQLFKASSSKNNTWVFLQSEGWHQYERADGTAYKHVTVRYNGWTYHCYTEVAGPGITPVSGNNTIDCISYQSGKNKSSYLYP